MCFVVYRLCGDNSERAIVAKGIYASLRLGLFTIATNIIHVFTLDGYSVWVEIPGNDESVGISSNPHNNANTIQNYDSNK